MQPRYSSGRSAGHTKFEISDAWMAETESCEYTARLLTRLQERSQSLAFPLVRITTRQIQISPGNAIAMRLTSTQPLAVSIYFLFLHILYRSYAQGTLLWRERKERAPASPATRHLPSTLSKGLPPSWPMLKSNVLYKIQSTCGLSSKVLLEERFNPYRAKAPLVRAHLFTPKILGTHTPILP